MRFIPTRHPRDGLARAADAGDPRAGREAERDGPRRGRRRQRQEHVDRQHGRAPQRDAGAPHRDRRGSRSSSSTGTTCRASASARWASTRRASRRRSARRCARTPTSSSSARSATRRRWRSPSRRPRRATSSWRRCTRATRCAPSTACSPSCDGDANENRMRIASCLQGIIAQRLLPRADGNGVVLASEVLVASHSVKESIRRPGEQPAAQVAHGEGHAPLRDETFADGVARSSSSRASSTSRSRTTRWPADARSRASCRGARTGSSGDRAR